MSVYMKRDLQFQIIISRSIARTFSESMLAWFDDHKGFLQLVFGIGLEHSFEFSVDRVLGRRQDAEINDAHTQGLDENKPAKVPIACDKYATLLLSRRE